MSPERVLRDYFHAKDGNRPGLLGAVFADDARLEVRSRSDGISFPALTTGREAIADVLVRRFNETYEDIRSFYLDRPEPDARSFACDWLVTMRERSSRAPRVGCGRYEWVFGAGAPLRVRHLVITIEVMLLLDPARGEAVSRWASTLDYPWTSAAEVMRALPADLEPIRAYLLRRPGWLSSTA